MMGIHDALWPRSTAAAPAFAAAARAAAALCLCAGLLSCSGADVASFPWKAAQGSNLGFRQSASFPKGDENKFSAARSENSFSLKAPLKVEPGYMFAVTMKLRAENLVVALSFGQSAKNPGRTVSFAALPGRTAFYLRAPDSRSVKHLTVAVKSPSGQPEGKDGTSLAEIESVALLPAFLGYERLKEGGYRVSEGLTIGRQSRGSSLWTIEGPFGDLRKSDGKKSLVPALRLKYAATSDADIVVKAGTKVVIRAASAKKEALLPVSVFPDAEKIGSIALTVPEGVNLESASIESLPEEEALLLDPGVVLLQPAPAEGQDLTYCRWDLLPNVVMFDFRDYAVQDSYLKRLAFFVEKRGFAGRLAEDEEIAALHGWNAHDYKTEDLAKFFTAAKKTGFSLNAKELWLRDFLIENRLIASRGQEYKGLGGAIISISRESPPYLRHTFLTHESSHAIFFADERYSAYCISMWNAMSQEEKWFWVLYFGWMRYDIGSAYLMANEMQAYLIQQPAHKAEEYFTKTLTERLLEKNPELKAPLDAYVEKFGPEFVRKAGLLDGWLRAEYGFGAGTTFFVR